MLKLNAVKTAIFPVAGLGTRFLPITKSTPKEMLPLVDKPLIQYAVEEAITAGCDHLIFVTSNNKRAIEDYFDSNLELESILTTREKIDLIASINDIVPHDVKISYVRQRFPAGLGDAVLCAKHVIGDAAFALLLPDDIIVSSAESGLTQMVTAYNEYQRGIIAVEPVSDEQVSEYGIVDVDSHNNTLSKIKRIVEKPPRDQAPSNLGVIGRYILPPTIFKYLESQHAGVGNEIQLTDALSEMLRDSELYAYALQGTRYDCGSKVGYINAFIDFALARDDVAAEVRAHITAIANAT